MICDCYPVVTFEASFSNHQCAYNNGAFRYTAWVSRKNFIVVGDMIMDFIF